MRRILIFLFHCLLFFVPFAFTPYNDELFEFNKMLLTYALTATIVSLWAARMIQEKRIIFRSTLFFWPLLFLLASNTISTIFSLDISTSFFGYYSRFHGGLLSTFAYTALYFAAVSNLSWKEIRGLVRTTLLSSLVVCLYAIPEHFGVSPSCALITGEWNVSCWVQDVQTRVFATFGQPNWLAAYLLMTIPLAIWFWYAPVRDFLQKKFFSLDLIWPPLTILASLMTLAYTRSRSGFLALFAEIGLIAGGILMYWITKNLFTESSKKSSKTSYLPIFLGSMLVSWALVFFVVGTPFTSTLSEKIQHQIAKNNQPAATASSSSETTAESAPATPPPAAPSGTVLENGGTDSGTIRRIVWKGALKVWQRYPIFGSGVETFAYSYYLDRPLEHNLVSEWDYLYNKAHNEFLNTLANTGIVGLAALLTLMTVFTFVLVQDIFPFLKKGTENFNDENFLFSLMLLTGYTGVAISNFFGFSTVMVGILFFLFKSFWWINKEKIEETDGALAIKTSPSQSASALIQTPPKKSGYVSPAKKKSNQPEEFMELSFENSLPWLGYAFLFCFWGFLMIKTSDTWYNDSLLAQSKQYVNAGNATAAYTAVKSLTQRAPNEALYWDQESFVLARLAFGTYNTDASVAGQLAEQAILASNRSVELNPVHSNYWKTRARVFMILSTFNPEYMDNAVQALESVRELAPNDPKIAYNLALLHDSLNKPELARAEFEKTLELKPNYEQARTSYGEFLEKQGDAGLAREQYEYILKYLNPTAPTATEKLAIMATSSGILKK